MPDLLLGKRAANEKRRPHGDDVGELDEAATNAATIYQQTVYNRAEALEQMLRLPLSDMVPPG